MSIEIVLIPLALVLTKEISEAVSKRLESQTEGYTFISTRMKDEDLLRQALQEYSCSFRKLDAVEQYQQGGDNEVTFIVTEEGCYTLMLPQSADHEAFSEWVNQVEQSYSHYLQQNVYRNLIEKAKQQGMIMEKEEILEDNSIQVTYILNT